MERASSSCIFMSAARCRSAWKLAMATPNCLRVFMYSAVMARVLSITPTASAQALAMPMSTACSSAVRPSRVISVAGGILQRHFGGAAALLGAVALGADTAGGALHQKQGQLAIEQGGHHEGVGLITCWNYTFSSCQHMADGGLSRFCLTNIEAVASDALLIRQHHQRFAAGYFWQPGGFGGLWCVAAEHAACDQALVEWLQHDATPELFHHHHALDRAHAHAVILLRDVQAAQAQLGYFTECVA